ncbi:restriction endonuclease [Kitasatospora sp. NPDC051853]|uniref:restriction endonuclease n=1 Tax=Kitasatospora sp. NPDC051853 TaxID=3364058 RepID=UPI0037AB6304
MQYAPEGQSDGTAAATLQPGFLASLFSDLGVGEEAGAAAGDGGAGVPAEPSPEAAGVEAAEDEVAARGRAAVLSHQRTAAVRAEHEHLADLLRRAALPVSAMDFESQLRSYRPRPFPAAGGTEEPGPDGPEPRWEDFAPPVPEPQEGAEGAGRPLLDSGYQRELAQARLRHQRALREWRAGRAAAADDSASAERRAHEALEEARARAVQEYNDSLEECRRAYRLAEPAAVESLLERALAAAEGATLDLAAPCRAVFRPLTRTAVLDLDLPPLALVPSLDGYRLTTEDTVEPVPRPLADRANDYLRLVARLALRALQAADAVDTDEILTGVVLNGWLRDTPSGAPLCLLSVDADRDALARTRLLPAVADGDGWAGEGPEPGEGTDGAGHDGAADDGAYGGLYADAEQDEALVRLRELSAAVSPDPYGLVGVEPGAEAGMTVPTAEDLSAHEFAHLVRELLTRGGLAEWSVRLRGPAGLVATAVGEEGSALPGRWVVWASRPRGGAEVAAAELRTLVEAVREEGAERGLRLTTGRFAESALDLAAELPQIHLVDGDGVRELTESQLGMLLGAGG